MPPRAVEDLTILAPGDAARAMGVTTARLTELVLAGRYAYTALRPGGRPGDSGRGRWGLTPAQLRAVIDGQARQPAPAGAAEEPARRPASPDGINRLRRTKGRGR